MAGQLSDAQPMWVRFPQLRSCFSGAMEAQLFRNQQAVGSNPTGSSQILKYVPVIPSVTLMTLVQEYRFLSYS